MIMNKSASLIVEIWWDTGMCARASKIRASVVHCPCGHFDMLVQSGAGIGAGSASDGGRSIVGSVRVSEGEFEIERREQAGAAVGCGYAFEAISLLVDGAISGGTFRVKGTNITRLMGTGGGPACCR
jgi:hypothetical protein